MLCLAVLLFGQAFWRYIQHLQQPGALHASTAPSGLSAKDARGILVRLPAPPKRIVSLSPGTTEMLFAIGLKGRIVADTTYCDFPPEAKALPKIGDVNTSTEKVVAQRPDLIVADAVANRRAVEPLERLRLPVFTVAPTNLAETLVALRSLGKITGQTTQAEALAHTLEARTAAVQRAVAKSKDHPRVLIPVQMEPLMVVGSKNFMDDLITRAGGVNVGANSGPGWNAYSPEKVVVQRPDVILAGKETAEKVRQRSGWGNLPAVKNNRLYSPKTETVRPGPRLVDALEELARLLHPEAFSGRR